MGRWEDLNPGAFVPVLLVGPDGGLGFVQFLLQQSRHVVFYVVHQIHLWGGGGGVWGLEDLGGFGGKRIWGVLGVRGFGGLL